jgi:hypothetical protein
MRRKKRRVGQGEESATSNDTVKMCEEGMSPKIERKKK